MGKDVFSQLLQPVWAQQTHAPLPDLSACPRLQAVLSWLRPLKDSPEPVSAPPGAEIIQYWLSLPEFSSENAWHTLLSQPGSTLSDSARPLTKTLSHHLAELLEMFKKLILRVSEQMQSELPGLRPEQLSHTTLMQIWLTLYQQHYQALTLTPAFTRLWQKITELGLQLLSLISPAET